MPSPENVVRMSIAWSAMGSATIALDAIGAGGVDVVVTDLRMPELDGFAPIDRIRATHPEIRVIVMTAHGALDSATEAVRRGAYHYLTKPFKLDELVWFVRRALADRTLTRG